MLISFAQRVSVPSDVLIREVEGQSVILSLQSERYFGLDEMGTRMWTALTTCESIQAAYEALLSEYDVDGELLRRDLQDLIARLVEHGLVEVSGE